MNNFYAHRQRNTRYKSNGAVEKNNVKAREKVSKAITIMTF